MKCLLLACDLEEYTLPQDMGYSTKPALTIKYSLDGVTALLELLAEKMIRMTFFTTPAIAEANPGLLRSLAGQGHEIGLHSVIPAGLAGNAGLLEETLRNEKKKLESVTGTEICGFKSHRLVLLPYKILQAAGFKYDNSCHPTFVPGRYFNLFRSGSILVRNGFVSIPISVMPFTRLPFSWIWFRNFGLGYAKLCAKLAILQSDYVNIYFHSWEFAEIKDEESLKMPAAYLRNSGKRMLRNIGLFTDWCRNSGLKTSTIGEYLRSSGLLG